MKWRMRQWYVDDRAIPPDMNAKFNRCEACYREWRRTGKETAVCTHHHEELMNYANSRPAPPIPLKRKVIRTEWSVDMKNAPKEVW
jgi:hypothetical protein